MKLTVFFLTAFLAQATASSYSQQITFSGKDVSLETIFSVVEKQTGYVVFYNYSAIKDSRKITINARGIPLKDFLDKCIENQSLTYSIENKTVLVTKAKPSSFPQPSSGTFDRIQDTLLDEPPVKGIVKDSTGMALSGATVVNKRTRKSVQTNGKGEFTLEANPGDVLQVSFVGYQQKEIRVSGNSVFALLNISNSPLDEVQIQAYGTTSRRISTSAIYSIRSEEIARQPVDNPLYALQGRVPNLIITPGNGLPGAPVKIQLRGQNSLAKIDGVSGIIPTQPLIVIDGVPYTNNIAGPGYTGGFLDEITNSSIVSALSFINAKDIESIDVLADADATAIYGSRGGNGVILITTKKGRMGRTAINVSSSLGFSEVAKKLDLLNTQEYLAMRKEAYANDGLALPTTPDPTNYDLTLWDQNRYTDWQEKFLGRTAGNSTTTASISGGNSGIQYLISGTFNRQSYVFPGNDKDQTGSGHFSLTGTSTNSKFRATVSGTYTSNERLSFGGAGNFSSRAVTLAPNAPELYKANGALNWGGPDPLTGFGSWDNPYAVLELTSKAKTNTVYASADLSYKILPSLTLKTTVGFSENRLSSINLTPLTFFDPTTITPNNITGSSERSNNSSRSWTVDPQAVYTTQVAKGRLDILAGASFQEQNKESQYLYASGYTNDALLQNLGSALSLQAYNTNSQYKYAALFGRATYNWNGKYIINLNARRDGSSRFGPGRQFGNFGSVGAAWIFSEEKFAKNALPFVSFGKLRASYGSSGHDNIGDYLFLELFSPPFVFTSFTYQGAVPLLSSGAANQDYGWESVKKAEIALEAGFFKDRILLNVAYWQNRSSDQLGTSPMPATAGNSSITFNQPAKIQNTGWDVVLNTTNIKSKHFTWTSIFNVGIARNKLLALPEGFNGGGITYGYPSTEAAIGQPFSGIVPVYEFRGVDPVTGLYQFTGEDGKPTSDPSQITPNNSMNNKRVVTRPDYSGGFSNRFTYKAFSLDVFMQFTRQTGKNYLYDPAFFNTVGGPGSFAIVGVAIQPKEVLARWQNPGDVTSIAKFSTGNTYDLLKDIMRNSDAAWVDASFIRIKNVYLSYNIAEAFKQKLPLQDLKIYLQAQNLFTFTKYKGPDPETQSVLGLPPLRTIVAGIAIGF